MRKNKRPNKCKLCGYRLFEEERDICPACRHEAERDRMEQMKLSLLLEGGMNDGQQTRKGDKGCTR